MPTLSIAAEEKGLAQRDVRWVPNGGVPTDGTTGTGAGICGKGSLCTDFTNGNLYINAGTKASPTWKLVTKAV